MDKVNSYFYFNPKIFKNISLINRCPNWFPNSKTTKTTFRSLSSNFITFLKYFLHNARKSSMRITSAGTTTMKCSSKAEKNYKKKSYPTSSGTSTSPLSSDNSTCTSSAKSPNSPNKETTCTSRTNSSNAAKCTSLIDAENNSPKSSATIKRTAAPPTTSRILLCQTLKNPFKRMMSAWWIKSHKKMRP